MLLYIFQFLTFLVAIISIKGGTWNDSKKGLRKITMTGRISLFILCSSFIVSIFLTYQTNLEGEELKSKLKSSLEKLKNLEKHSKSIAKKLVTNDRKIELSHIMIDVPLKLLQREDHIKLPLTGTGYSLNFYLSRQISDISIATFSDNGNTIYISLVNYGYNHIDIDVIIDTDRSFIREARFHLEFKLDRTFMLIASLEGYSYTIEEDDLSPILNDKTIIYDHQVLGKQMGGCPYFLQFNNSNENRYILCDLTNFTTQKMEMCYKSIDRNGKEINKVLNQKQ